MSLALYDSKSSIMFYRMRMRLFFKKDMFNKLFNLYSFHPPFDQMLALNMILVL